MSTKLNMEHVFYKDIIVLVIGTKNSGKKSLIQAFNDAKRSDRYYFPSENIQFIQFTDNALKLGMLKPDVIWFITNYHGCTKDEDFDILQQYFPQTPVVVVLNKVDQLQQYNGHAFDLIATKLPDVLEYSDQLRGIQRRYQLLQRHRRFLLNQVMLTSMRSEEETDRPAGLLGLYQATLSCMDDKQFDITDETSLTLEGRRHQMNTRSG